MRGAPLRVLHVTPYFAPAFGYGGPPRSILGLCRALSAAGVSATVFTTTANGRVELDVPSPSVLDGVVVHYFPRTFPKRFFGAKGLAGALGPEIAGRADLVHLHGLWNLPAWAAARLSRRHRRPYVISPRGMLEKAARSHNPWRKRIALPLVEARNLRGAALLHATSHAEVVSLGEFAPSVPVLKVPNGIDVPDLPSIERVRGTFRSRLGLDSNDATARLVVFLGRLHPIKRLDLLVDAFRLVRGSWMPSHGRGRGPQLVIAGRDEFELRPSLLSRLSEAATAAHFVGELGDDNKRALLADASVLALCSDSESFGLSVAEGLAAAVPAVVTTTCPWQALEEEHCGFWVPQDATRIAEGLLRVLSNDGKARAMGLSGRDYVAREFSWSAVARQMLRGYRRALGDVGLVAQSSGSMGDVPASIAADGGSR